MTFELKYVEDVSFPKSKLNERHALIDQQWAPKKNKVLDRCSHRWAVIDVRQNAS